MRVCLISSVNLSSWYACDGAPAMLSLPLGLLSLAAVLEQAGHQVTVVDLNAALCAGEIRLDAGFYQAAAALIGRGEPQVAGFSTMCNSYHIALRLAEAVKACLPGVTVIFGGPQASVADVETLEAFPAADMILRGEAEATLPALLESLAHGQLPADLPGLTYRGARGVVRNPDAPLLADLDALPQPAYHLLPDLAKAVPAIDAGRGCPFACSFCSTSTFWRRHFRLKSTGRTLAEMRALRRDYGVETFNFMHDLFTINRGRLLDFCRQLKQEQWPVTWTCSARVDCVDEALLREMAAAGCTGIFYGIESGSPRMQRRIGKNLRLDQVEPVLAATLGAGMATTLSFIAGFPDETAEDLRQTANMVRSLLGRPGIKVQLHLLAPQRGTADARRYAGRLRFDGYYSDIAGGAYQYLEPAWFGRYPELFSSFGYWETEHVPRALLRGLDVFINGPGNALPRTMAGLLAGGGDLWDLYLRWQTWGSEEGRGRGPAGGQSLDDLLLDFYAFASAEAAAGCCRLDLGDSRDEILAFYLQAYNNIPVRFVTPAATEEAEANH